MNGGSIRAFSPTFSQEMCSRRRLLHDLLETYIEPKGITDGSSVVRVNDLIKILQVVAALPTWGLIERWLPGCVQDSGEASRRMCFLLKGEN